MPTRDSADWASSVEVSDVLAVYGSTSTPLTPYASRVADDVAGDVGALLVRLGRLTWKPCMTAGQIAPIRIEVSASRPRPIAGSVHDRRKIAEKNSTAQTIATKIRMFLLGMRACSSV